MKAGEKPILNPGKKQGVNILIATTAEALKKAGGNKNSFVKRFDPEGRLPNDDDSEPTFGIQVF